MNISLNPHAADRIRPASDAAVIRAPKASGQSRAVDFGSAYALDLSAKGKAYAENNEKKADDHAIGGSDSTKKADGTECQTCKSRMYQDGSNEGNVSFKTPGHIAPENSAAAVLSHEREHVSNAKAEDAGDENKELISCSVRIYTATCPECGRTYTAGGETQTTMKTTIKQPDSDQTPDNPLGQNIDIAA